MQTIVTIILAGIGSVVVAAMITIMRQLRNMHLAMNSRLDELLSTTKSLARAEGFKAGQEDHLAGIRKWEE